MKYRLGNNGDISWLLSQFSLFLATSFLLLSIAGFAFYNDWIKEAEIKNIASNFASAIYGVDLNSFPSYQTFTFLDKNFSYQVSISTDYIRVIRNDGRIRKNIEVNKKLLIKIYPRCDNWDWKSGEELKKFIEEERYKDLGYSNPKDYLAENLSKSIKFFSYEQMIIYPKEKVFIEKMEIYGEEYVLIYKR
ncbi:MAG: hypothetical protein H5T44_03175 [Thermoplasmatales archaeon]|nr:hypothetical protein [Thermoplasmatales archaeon]